MFINSRRLIFTAILTIALSSFCFAQTSSVADTYWVGNDDDDILTIHFEKDGKVSYSHSGNSFRNGTWKQDGVVVTFEFNEGYRTFSGKVVKDTLRGDSKNAVDRTWTTTFFRFSQPNCDPRVFTLEQLCTPMPADNKPATPAVKSPMKKP